LGQPKQRAPALIDVLRVERKQSQWVVDRARRVEFGSDGRLARIEVVPKI
jgi:hypothetical protein